MSQFNKNLDKAQTRQERIYLISGVVVMGIILLLVALIIYSRGTRIEVMPLEAGKSATISVIDSFSFSIGDVVYSLAGNPIINVSASGYKVRTETIGSEYLGKVFPLELFELPGRLIIKILGDEENLSKTSWEINGRDTTLSAMLDHELEAGIYNIKINNPYFQPKELTVEIQRRKQTKLQVDLQPVDGRINISSRPVGAKVFLNDGLIGETPLELSQNGGLYTLRVTDDNYVDTIEEFEITHFNSKVNRNYKLSRIKAKITPKLIPKGGKLLVNGILAKEPIFLSTKIQHILTYMKPGYYSETKELWLSSDQEEEISFQLKPEVGQIEISSSPPATIWINNKDYGNNAITVSLPAVTHKIAFKKPGYRSVLRTVTPTGKFVQKVSAKMLTEYQARLREAPRELTNKVGIKLKLFIKPGYI